MPTVSAMGWTSIIDEIGKAASVVTGRGIRTDPEVLTAFQAPLRRALTGFDEQRAVQAMADLRDDGLLEAIKRVRGRVDEVLDESEGFLVTPDRPERVRVSAMQTGGALSKPLAARVKDDLASLGEQVHNLRHRAEVPPGGGTGMGTHPVSGWLEFG